MATQKQSTGNSMSKIFIAIVAVLFVAAVLVVSIIAVNKRDEKHDKLVLPTNKSITLEGEFACLPHKGDGPHTLECASAIVTDKDRYYGLDFTNTQGIFPTSGRLRVTGTLKEPQSDIYISEGTIVVDSFEEL